MFKLLPVLLLCGAVGAELSRSADDNNNTVEASTLPGLLGDHKRVVVCFISIDANQWLSQSQFAAGCRLCTHIVYTGLVIDPMSAKLRNRIGFSPDLRKLKKRCPHIKLALSVHQEAGTSAFSIISASANLRKQFVNSAHSYVQDYDYDGLDLDLNLDNATDLAMTTNKSNLLLIIKDLRQSLSDGKILTASLSKDTSIIDAAYDIPAFVEHLQYMHIKSFAYHDANDGFTAPTSPLQSKDSSDTVASTVEHLKSLGAPASKLVLGVPMFGHTFLLTDVVAGGQVKHFGSAVEGTGMKGPFTNRTGFMGYSEICFELKEHNDSWNISWDTVSRTPYAQSGAQWMSYEDERSVHEKVRYAVREDLAGVAVWTLDLDDAKGQCGNTFPLINMVHIAMIQATNDATDPFEEVSTDSSDWFFPLTLAIAVIMGLILAVAALCLKFRIPLNCPDAGMI